jgi:hypothetical protein
MSVYSEPWYKEEIVKAERGNREHIAKYDRSFAGIMAKLDAADGDVTDRRNDGGNASVHLAVQMATLLVASGKFPGHAQALHHLLNTSRGQALLQRMSKAEAHTGKDHSTMDRTAELRDIAKAGGGIIAIAKAITDENRNYGISEQEFVELASESAQAEFPTLSKAQAFAKLYENPTIWRACNLLKSMPFVADFTPLVVGGEANRGGDVNPDDPAKAIEQLKELGARKWPSASEAAQFANAFTDPANAVLANRAHKRPAATTSFEWPR